MRKGQIVRITWIDIITELGVAKLGDAIEAITIGVVEEQDAKVVKIKSGYYTNTKDWPDKDGSTIPKGCIEKVEILEVKK